MITAAVRHQPAPTGTPRQGPTSSTPAIAARCSKFIAVLQLQKFPSRLLPEWHCSGSGLDVAVHGGGPPRLYFPAARAVPEAPRACAQGKRQVRQFLRWLTAFPVITSLTNNSLLPPAKAARHNNRFTPDALPTRKVSTMRLVHHGLRHLYAVPSTPVSRRDH